MTARCAISGPLRMPKRTRALGLSFALALCATLTATAADTIHRWVDTDGRVH